MIGWDNGLAGHAGRWVWIGLPCSILLSIMWAVQYVLTVISTAPFWKDITLAIENYKSFATFLNNIDALNLAAAIDRSVGKSDGLLSAHFTWHKASQTRCSYKQNRVKGFQSAVKHSSVYTGKIVATFSDKFLILSESRFYCKLKCTVS